jgi:nicotinamidase-related amidase
MDTALIIIDIQNDYFEGGSMTLVGAEKASLNAQKILNRFRENKSLIIHIQHISLGKTKNYFLPKTIGAEINKNVKPINGEKIITKYFPNSFRRTDLLDYLKSKDIKNMVICGMMTHMCVDATTRAAKDLEFNITLIGDACATKDLEISGQEVKAIEVQKSFLAAMSDFYATIKVTDQYLEE